MEMVNQYDIYWVNLDPTIGHEIKKTRPCIIVSPDELNKWLGTVLVAPLTSSIKDYPFRTSCLFNGKSGSIAIDQMRCTDKSRLLKKGGSLTYKEIKELKAVLEEMLIK